MKLEEYVEQFNGAPYDLLEFAHGAAAVQDNEQFRDAARRYILATNDFENMLATLDIEIG